ncbi:PspC domain-containing protein [Mobiluncus mulieris]|uniref:PspC domain-containing protein n=1 Tax=Mobiluncus mulieris TaxID=2052 RepID=UPI002016594D|nr:PspC domain-containing protein [Mobiluncus mulieris]
MDENNAANSLPDATESAPDATNSAPRAEPAPHETESNPADATNTTSATDGTANPSDAANPPDSSGAAEAPNTDIPTNTFASGNHQVPPPRLGFFDRLRAATWKRLETNKVAGGVCAGLAEKMGIDPIIVRGIAVVLMLFTGLGMLAYGLAWLLLPEKTSGRTLFEDAKYGQAQPIMAFPILVAVLGFFRIFPEINVLTQPFGIAPLAWVFGGFGWVSHLSGYFDSSAIPAIFIFLAFIAAGSIVICATIWVCMLFYRRKYSQAWTVCLVVGFGSLLGTIAEVILTNSLGNFPIFPLFTMTFMGVMGISPISIPAFIICAAVGAGKRNTPPYQPGYTPAAGTVPPNTVPPSTNSTGSAFVGSTSSAGDSGFAGGTSGQPLGVFPATSAAPAAPYVPYVAGIHEVPAPNAAQPQETTCPGFTQPSYAPPAPTAISMLPPRPGRVAGPSRAFNLAIAGLVLLVIFAGNLAQYFQLWPRPEQYWLINTGAITVVLGVGMLVLALRRRRLSWLAWVTPLVVFMAVVPSLIAAEIAPEVRGLTKNWSWENLPSVLDDHEKTLYPGDSAQGVDANYNIDLRGQKDTDPIEAQSVSGTINIYLHPDQPVRVKMQQFSGEIRLSAMNSWTEPGNPKRGFFQQARTYTERPQYLSADGTRRVLFTDRALQVETRKAIWGTKAGKGKTYLLENAATQGKVDVQEITVACVDCIVSIYERPSEVLWNGKVLPDGHFLINYWLDENSQRQELDNGNALPPVLTTRIATRTDRLAGLPAKEIAPRVDSHKPLTLTEVQDGALGPWEDKNNDGFNDLYQPGGSQWKAGDTLFNPKTGAPLPYQPKKPHLDDTVSESRDDSETEEQDNSEENNETEDTDPDEGMPS